MSYFADFPYIQVTHPLTGYTIPWLCQSEVMLFSNLENLGE